MCTDTRRDAHELLTAELAQPARLPTLVYVNQSTVLDTATNHISFRWAHLWT
jgi:hypothetical protein